MFVGISLSAMPPTTSRLRSCFIAQIKTTTRILINTKAAIITPIAIPPFGPAVCSNELTVGASSLETKLSLDSKENKRVRRTN